MICLGILISVILGTFPGETLTQILHIGHNFQEKEHTHISLILFESTLCIPNKTYLTVDEDFQAVFLGGGAEEWWRKLKCLICCEQKWLQTHTHSQIKRLNVEMQVFAFNLTPSVVMNIPCSNLNSHKIG